MAQGLALHVGRVELFVDRFELLHDLDLAVLELGDVPGQVLDLVIHGLEVAGRRHLAAVHPLFQFRPTGPRHLDLALQGRLADAELVAPRLHLGRPALEAGQPTLDCGQLRLFGQRGAPVT